MARAADEAGRLSEAATTVYVTRQGEFWFEQDNDDRIDVLELARTSRAVQLLNALADIASVKTGLADIYAAAGRPFASTHPMFGPSQAARNIPASFGDTIRLVAVTPE